ncbi:MAG: NAD(P)H-dependent oxidoreductase [Lonepinella koalarum]|nr:NAD(P)H-dependent oxidoreductase [Lonepinella koalarum]
MKHLIILAHPNKNSFNSAILQQVVDATEKQGAEVVIRNLYSLNFSPILSWEELQGSFQGIIPIEVRQEQQFIRQADLITVIYPLWWMGFPAILKGYWDRVLTFGFAYQHGEKGSIGLLEGKKLQQFVTVGNNIEAYQAKGFTRSLDDCLINGLFNFCGITDIDYELFGDIHLLNEQQRQDILFSVAHKTTENLTALST